MFTTRTILFRPEFNGLYLHQSTRKAKFQPFATVFDMGDGDRIIGIGYSISDDTVNEVNDRVNELRLVKYGRYQKEKYEDKEGKIRTRKKWIEVTRVHTPVLAVHYEITNGDERFIGISVCAKEEPTIDIRKGIAYARKRALKSFVEKKGWVIAMIDRIISGDINEAIDRAKSRNEIRVVDLQNQKDEYEKNEHTGLDLGGESYSIKTAYNIDDDGNLEVVDIEEEE